MSDLPNTISNLLAIAESDSPNRDAQATAAIDDHFVHERSTAHPSAGCAAAGHRLLEEFTKASPGTDRSNFIQDMIYKRVTGR